MTFQRPLPTHRTSRALLDRPLPHFLKQPLFLGIEKRKHCQFLSNLAFILIKMARLVTLKKKTALFIRTA